MNEGSRRRAAEKKLPAAAGILGFWDVTLSLTTSELSNKDFQRLSPNAKLPGPRWQFTLFFAETNIGLRTEHPQFKEPYPVCYF